jgi:SAM-dependent methyltransferase
MTDSIAIARWLDTPLGRTVHDLEAELLAEALADVFGFELLQVGSWGPAESLSGSARTQHRRWVAPDAEGPGAIRAVYDHLPIATGSVEAVLLPHTLEYATDPHELLREVDRVLVGEGHVLICGFNPYGPWGVRHLASRRRFPPTAARLLSESRIADWLRLLGLEIVSSRRYLFASFWSRRLSGRSRSWLERHGPTIAAPLAGAYLVKARKRVVGLTPIYRSSARRPLVVVGAPEPTSRNAA